jgi:hypothetical protein
VRVLIYKNGVRTVNYKRIPLSNVEAAAVWEDLTGLDVHPTTLSRWAVHGVNGIRLVRRRTGGRLTTTRADLERFLAALNASEVTA